MLPTYFCTCVLKFSITCAYLVFLLPHSVLFKFLQDLTSYILNNSQYVDTFPALSPDQIYYVTNLTVTNNF